MDLSSMVAALNGKDTSKAFEILKELERFSEDSDMLYPLIDTFIAMSQSKTNVIRVRGFRLLCKQARWDRNGKINESIADVLNILNDDKPTTVRQALQFLNDVVPYKRELCGIIKQAVLSIDLSRFKDTMRPLIEKDIRVLLQLMGEPA